MQISVAIFFFVTSGIKTNQNMFEKEEAISK